MVFHDEAIHQDCHTPLRYIRNDHVFPHCNIFTFTHPKKLAIPITIHKLKVRIFLTFNSHVMKQLYTTSQTVFDLKSLGKIRNEPNYDRLKSKAAYYASKGYLTRIRQGVYVKTNFNYQELACMLYTPSYISFETILQQEGIIYQYDETIYCASYLSKKINISYQEKTIKIIYRKLKDDILYDMQGISTDNYVSKANASRAIKDMSYLKSDFYFDNLPDEPTTTPSHTRQIASPPHQRPIAL